MGFLNSVFLIGLLAAGVPILIHLLTRDRVQRVAFSTLRFFANVSRSVLRRKRFREAILLAMRAAACALLALVFARPFLRSSQSAWGGLLRPGTARVIVVDLSASMGREGMLEPLRNEAVTAVNSLAEGRDLAALVTFGDTPELDVALTRELGEVRARAVELAPGHGGTQIAAAIQQADTLLRPVPARAKEIWLISDLQRSGWSGADRASLGRLPALAPDVRLVVRPVEPAEKASNVAVVDADTPQSTAASREPRPLAFRIARFADPDAGDRQVDVALSIGGKEVATQKVKLPPNGSVPVRFRHVFDTAGDNPGVLRVGGKDAVPADDAFHFNVRVIPRIKVVILNGRPAADPMADGAYFLKMALSPAEDSPFEPRSIDASRAHPGEIDDAQVAVLADVGRVAPDVREALARLLARGGGLLFLPGGRVDAEAFNETLADLAPCRLRRKLTPSARAGEEAEARIISVEMEHAIFEVFQRPHHGDLSTPRFTQFWEVTDSQLARVLARFDDGRPAMLERLADGKEPARGVSLMLVAPADLTWSTLPLRAIFLPLVHQSVRYLAVRTEVRTAFHVGDRLPVQEAVRRLRVGEGWSLRGPDGAAREGAAAVAVEPGLHAVVASGGDTAFQFAVNLNPAEADPASVDPQEILSALQGSRAQPEGEEAEDDATQRAGALDEQGLWWYVLLAVVVLSMGELTLGNHTLRH